jgi:hypothetical protein
MLAPVMRSNRSLESERRVSVLKYLLPQVR